MIKALLSLFAPAIGGAKTQKRSFIAAGLTPALASWTRAAPPPNNDIQKGLRKLIARSRDASQNDDHMRQFLRMTESNIIGNKGLSVQPRPKTKSGAPDKTARVAIESAYSKQSKRGNWDVTGEYSRAAFSRLGVRTVAQDGAVLIRIHESENGFAVELIDSMLLDMDYTATLSNGHTVEMGVERDELLRPVAYHVFTYPKPQAGYNSGQQRQRISAAGMIHAYLPEWVGQVRGVPWASTAMVRMKMLAGYEEAAITAARGAAVKAGVYTQSLDAPPGSQPAGYDEVSQINQELSPGMSEMLPPGWDYKPLDWAWPNTDHGQFTKECLRGIAGGLGISYNTLANDLESVNYSSLRQGALTERETWTALQEWWIDFVELPLYEKWLSWAFAAGIISRPSGMPIQSSEEKLCVSFQGRRWPWVDPLKDMQAASLALKLRTRSISDLIREQGREPGEVWTELASDLEMLDRLGLTPEEILIEETPDAEGNTDDQSND